MNGLFQDAHAFDGRNGEPPLTVSALNRRARQLLESGFPLQWISGEISNLTRAASGHLYFTLKDAQAQVRCAMWRSRAQRLPFRPENGMQIEARALVTLYEARGEFQLTVEGLRLAGAGNLFEAFNRLKHKLEAEGLFVAADKRPLPPYPRGIGVVTSPQAAALRDVLAALARRAPGVPVIVYPSAVQGMDAPAQLLAALLRANARAAQDRIDVLLLVRGGGSLEDLWAFNDEALARAIHASALPVISGVGHETDFSISDFVADLRAATPTAAAEFASAGYHAAVPRLEFLSHRLVRSVDSRIQQLAQRVDRAGLRLLHPRQRLERSRQTLSHLEQSLEQAMRRRLQGFSLRLDARAARLQHLRPGLETRRAALARAADTLRRATRQALERRAENLEQFGLHLAHLNPEAVLGRGYSITRTANGVILRDSHQAKPGDPVNIQLAHGRLQATVNASEDGIGLSGGIIPN